jgi:hypothetical protein
VGNCDAQTNNIMLSPGGCTLSDELSNCEAASTTQKQYLACVNSHTASWVKFHFITRAQQTKIKVCAAAQ